MPVYSGENLKKVQLILIYDKFSGREADGALDSLEKCQSQIGVKTQQVEKLQLPDCRGDPRKLENTITSFIEDLENNGIERKLCFAVVILDRKDQYQRIKGILTR